MKRQEERIVVEGLTLQRYLYLPRESLRGAAVLFHGQGDFIGRYEPLLPSFLERGIAVLGADLPGHGRSPGRRGHVPGIHFIDALADSHLTRLETLAPAGPLGLMGHSLGGLLALHTLLRLPHRWDFSWLSSPLVKPEASQPPLKAALFTIVSRLVPWLSVDTGVTEESCLSTGAREWGDEVAGDDLFHTRITLSWAREVQAAAERARDLFRENPPAIPLFITQGGEDPICPPEEIKDLLEGAAPATTIYREFAGLRHEPFADVRSAVLLQALDEFVAATVSSPPRRDRAGDT